MARHYEPTADEEKEYREYADSLSEPLRGLAHRFTPWSLHRMKRSGQIALPLAVFGDGTVEVAILPDFNPGLAEGQRVFGINPNDLEPILRSVN